MFCFRGDSRHKRSFPCYILAIGESAAPLNRLQTRLARAEGLSQLAGQLDPKIQLMDLVIINKVVVVRPLGLGSTKTDLSKSA